MSKAVTVTIYAIKCAATGRLYIGSAMRKEERWRNHRRELAAGKHANSYLQRSCKKYGLENLSIEVKEVCEVKDRWIREQWWINKLRTYDPKYGFNIVPTVRELPQPSVLSKRLKRYWKKRWADPEYKERRTAELNGISKKPGVRAKMSASKLASWNDPAYRELQSKKHREYANRNKAKLASAAKAMWADPEYRAKQLAERKKRFADPAFRAKLSKAAQNRIPRAKWLIVRPSHNEIV